MGRRWDIVHDRMKEASMPGSYPAAFTFPIVLAKRQRESRLGSLARRDDVFPAGGGWRARGAAVG